MKIQYFQVKRGSDKSFGIVFSIIFFILGFYPSLFSEIFKILFISIALILFLVSFLAPSVLKPLNKLWFGFGMLLGSIISPIIMGIIFFLVITPIGIVLQLFRKDVLRIKIEKSIGSYWILRKYKIGTMKKQF